MADFVLELKKQNEEILSSSDMPKISKIFDDYAKILNYAQFLKQHLTLGMFVPVDEKGNVWEKPKGCCSGRECGCMGQVVNYYSQEDIDKYYDLEEKVLFKGIKFNNIQPSNDWNYFSLNGHKIAEGTNLGKYHLKYRLNTIEDLFNLVGEVELTESGIKQIGL